jgi:hypothetical protein
MLYFKGDDYADGSSHFMREMPRLGLAIHFDPVMISTPNPSANFVG